jgi:hypothetical protein
MNQIQFKRGDTFLLTCTYKVNGVATSVASLTIDSQIRNNVKVLVQDLIVYKQISTGVFTLSATAEETADWPVSVLRCDVQFSENGIVKSTDTFAISVIEDITK